jgi:Trypsin-like peptidase domain
VSVIGDFRKAVVFIVAADRDDRLTPVGTGFLVAVPGESDPARWEYIYIVTAAHCVRPQSAYYVRLSARDGGVTDVRLEEGWTFHPKQDVAVTGFDTHQLRETFKWRAFPITPFTDYSRSPELGDPVHFLGLLPRFTSMADMNLPMVRSGSVGALYQSNVPLRVADTVFHVDAHLVDCRSYAGFSGSPCFYEYFDFSGGFGVTYRLLGLMSGHFDDMTAAQVSGELADMGEIRVAINTGVGVVTPAEDIIDTLRLPELVDQRLQGEAEARALGMDGPTE